MSRVVFVGAGPGAPDLLTLRGARRLAEADVVLYDALVDDVGMRALAPAARWVDVGKRGAAATEPSADGAAKRGRARCAAGEGGSGQQAVICALIVRHAGAGSKVVRLKGGDPSVFGRLEEELEALAAAGIDCEIVPGVTAASAAAAEAKKPLTRRGRGRSVTLATAMTKEGRLVAGRRAESEVYYMAGTQLAALGRRLADAGWAKDAPVSVVSRAGCADAVASEHVVASLAEAALVHAGRPTIVVVGVAAEPIRARRVDDGARNGRDESREIEFAALAESPLT